MKPRDQVKEEHVRDWLRRAEVDLGVARQLIMQTPTYSDAVAFHAQQAAEKYVKACLVHREIDFPKTHDLERLLDLVALVDRDLAESMREATVLTDYGVDVRYPSGRPTVTISQAETAIRLADMVREAVLTALTQYREK